MNKTAINWGVGQLYTWNPITGCLRNCSTNGKSWCYARRIYERYHPGASFSDVIFHEERLRDPDLEDVKPRTIFLGSMSDPEYYKEEHFRRIIETCAVHRQHTFMFLSKNPHSYQAIKSWPTNCMQGMTLERCETTEDNYKVTLLMAYPRPFLSIEPLMGNFYYNPSFAVMEKIIIGAMTGPGAIKPESEWIESIKQNMPQEKVFWKPSMKGWKP
jgi:protein gp37